MTTAMDIDELAAVDVAALTTTEAATLASCEATIEQGTKTFLEVGNALSTIRDQRLYRADYGSFEEYLQERWASLGGRRVADRLIAAAEIEADLRPIGLTLENESQARPLTSLTPDQRREVVKEAAATAPNGKPTAAQIAKAAEKHKPAPAPKPAPIQTVAPTPAPVMLTPLAPTAPKILDVQLESGVEAIKLLLAKRVLLEEVRVMITDEMRALGALQDVDGESYVVTTRDGAMLKLPMDMAISAAAMFGRNPAFQGAAAMLAFAVEVQDA